MKRLHGETFNRANIPEVHETALAFFVNYKFVKQLVFAKFFKQTVEIKVSREDEILESCLTSKSRPTNPRLIKPIEFYSPSHGQQINS